MLRIASTVICLTVVASFIIFAVDQTSTAATRQQEQIAATNPTSTQDGSAPAHPKKQNAIKHDIDAVATELTSPFSGLVSGASGEWADRSVRLLLALLVYGFGLGYLARALRVRV
jgi:hypothetical protein